MLKTVCIMYCAEPFCVPACPSGALEVTEGQIKVESDKCPRMWNLSCNMYDLEPRPCYENEEPVLACREIMNRSKDTMTRLGVLCGICVKTREGSLKC